MCAAVAASPCRCGSSGRWARRASRCASAMRRRSCVPWQLWHWIASDAVGGDGAAHGAAQAARDRAGVAAVARRAVGRRRRASGRCSGSRHRGVRPWIALRQRARCRAGRCPAAPRTGGSARTGSACRRRRPWRYEAGRIVAAVASACGERGLAALDGRRAGAGCSAAESRCGFGSSTQPAARLAPPARRPTTWQARQSISSDTGRTMSVVASTAPLRVARDQPHHRIGVLAPGVVVGRDRDPLGDEPVRGGVQRHRPAACWPRRAWRCRRGRRRPAGTTPKSDMT